MKVGEIEAILEILWPFRLAEEISGLLCLITHVRRLKSSMPSSKKSNHLRYGELKVP